MLWDDTLQLGFLLMIHLCSLRSAARGAGQLLSCFICSAEIIQSRFSLRQHGSPGTGSWNVAGSYTTVSLSFFFFFVALCIQECVHLIHIFARAGLKLKEQRQLGLAKDLAKLKHFFSAIFLCSCE